MTAMKRTVPLLAAVLLLAGCSASPENAGAKLCGEKLQHAIEQGGVNIEESWLGADLTIGDVRTVDRGEPGVAAFDVTGTATVTLASGRELTVNWSCFTQTVDGETYAEIQTVG